MQQQYTPIQNSDPYSGLPERSSVNVPPYKSTTTSVISRHCSDDTEYEDEGCKQKCCRCSKLCWCRWATWTSITIFIILLLVFIAIFVVFPIVFMCSYDLQRKVIFMDIDQPSDPEYDNFAKYGAEGVRNFYVDLTNQGGSKLRLGAWQIVPQDELPGANNYTEQDFIKSLRNTKKPLIIYFHGQSGTRIYFYETYKVLRRYFHVIAFDYRHYGDSTELEPTESAVVQDSINFYRWVLSQSNQEEIYIWGHSLGTALSTHTLKELYTSKQHQKLLKPQALMLESPFTNMREEMENHPLMKYFKWLPYFDSTFLNPVVNNGFLFRTDENILKVKCPVMVVHAEDDGMIPVKLGKRVFQIANDDRPKQNQAMLFVVPSKVKANHMEIHKDPELPENIRKFLDFVKRIK